MRQIKIPNKESIILIILFIILLNHFNFFKNFYFLVNRDFSTRLNNVYQYCNNESVGFLFYIKKKYEIKQNIPIKNYKISISVINFTFSRDVFFLPSLPPLFDFWWACFVPRL